MQKRDQSAQGKQKREKEKSWSELLTVRKANQAFNNAENKKYRAAALDDRRRAINKLGTDAMKHQHTPRSDANLIPDNSSPLPDAHKDKPRASGIENWCRYGAWAICQKCHSILPREMPPSYLLTATPIQHAYSTPPY